MLLLIVKTQSLTVLAVRFKLLTALCLNGIVIILIFGLRTLVLLQELMCIKRPLLAKFLCLCGQLLSGLLLNEIS